MVKPIRTDNAEYEPPTVKFETETSNKVIHILDCNKHKIHAGYTVRGYIISSSASQTTYEAIVTIMWSHNNACHERAYLLSKPFEQCHRPTGSTSDCLIT